MYSARSVYGEFINAPIGRWGAGATAKAAGVGIYFLLLTLLDNILIGIQKFHRLTFVNIVSEIIFVE